jgi:hypothetical protein
VQTRSVLVALSLCVAAQAAAAPPNVVRVIWKVNAAAERWCYKAEPAATVTDFALPDDLTDCRAIRFDPFEPGKKAVLSPGDYLRVYAVQYNPVSFKPLAPQSWVIEPETPSSISVLAALYQTLTGAKALGERSELAIQPTERKAPAACDLARDRTIEAAERCLEEVGEEIDALGGVLGEWTERETKAAAAVAAYLEKAPIDLRDAPRPLTRLNQSLDAATREAEVGTFDELAGRLDSLVARAREKSGRAVAGALEFDAAFYHVDCSNRPVDCERIRIARKDVQVALLAQVRRLASEPDKGAFRTETAEAMASLVESEAIVARYRDALRPERAGRYAVEIPLRVSGKDRAVVVVNLPLQLREEGVDVQVVRSLSLRVAEEFPLVGASIGLASIYPPFEGFGFKTLAVQQVHAAAEALSTQLVVVDDGATRAFVPALMTHVRLPEVKLWDGSPLYLTVGTTSDKNIFKTVFLGASWLKREWRSAVTIGGVGAEGAKEDAVRDIRDRYSASDGAALPGLDLSQVPTGVERHWAFFVAWTFGPF